MGRINKVRPLLFLSTTIAVALVIVTAKLTLLGVPFILMAMFNAWAAGLLIGSHPDAFPWSLV